MLDHTRGHIDLEVLPDLQGAPRADCRFGARRQQPSARELYNMSCLR